MTIFIKRKTKDFFSIQESVKIYVRSNGSSGKVNYEQDFRFVKVMLEKNIPLLLSFVEKGQGFAVVSHTSQPLAWNFFL